MDAEWHDSYKRTLTVHLCLHLHLCIWHLSKATYIALYMTHFYFLQHSTVLITLMTCRGIGYSYLAVTLNICSLIY